MMNDTSPRIRPRTHPSPAEVPPPGVPRSGRVAPRHPAAADVADGLRATPRRLPSYLFYDEEGSRLFEEITRLPEYYLTRTELEILGANGAEIAAFAGAPRSVVELGAGTGAKTRLLLDLIAGASSRVNGYYPIDVSPAALEIARERLTRPGMQVHPLVGRHEEWLPRLRHIPGPRLLLFIGSSLGNYEPREAVELLALARRSLSPGDTFLLGADLRKESSVLVPAYDDASGVTAAFNRNILVRLNRELGADFDPAAFHHRAVWNDEESRMEMWLESARDQRVRVDAVGLELELAAGERIHTESSYKLRREVQLSMLREAGFVPMALWTDEARRYAVHCAAVP